jgi:xanthine dehydrogenase YagR molybdenum-binding subunit
LLNRWGQDVDRGDVTTALASAEVVYDETFTTAPVTNNPMGLFATVARWEGDRLTVHDASLCCAPWTGSAASRRSSGVAI